MSKFALLDKKLVRSPVITNYPNLDSKKSIRRTFK